jgi:hypothetical protein
MRQRFQEKERNFGEMRTKTNKGDCEDKERKKEREKEKERERERERERVICLIARSFERRRLWKFEKSGITY